MALKRSRSGGLKEPATNGSPMARKKLSTGEPNTLEGRSTNSIAKLPLMVTERPHVRSAHHLSQGAFAAQNTGYFGDDTNVMASTSTHQEVDATASRSSTPSGVDELVLQPASNANATRVEANSVAHDAVDVLLGFVPVSSASVYDEVAPASSDVNRARCKTHSIAEEAPSSMKTNLFASTCDEEMLTCSETFSPPVTLQTVNKTSDEIAVPEDSGGGMATSHYQPHDDPSVIKDSAEKLLVVKADHVIPVASTAINTSLRLKICSWVYRQCEARYAPLSTAFITMQLFDRVFGSGKARVARRNEAQARDEHDATMTNAPVFDTILLVASLSVALKHTLRESSLSASDCALVATHHFLNTSRHVFSKQDVTNAELYLLFETRWAIHCTPLDAVGAWASVIGVGIGEIECDDDDDDEIDSQQSFQISLILFKIITLGVMPPNVPACALGAAAVLAVLWRGTTASSAASEARLLEKVTELYPQLEQEQIHQMARHLIRA